MCRSSPSARWVWRPSSIRAARAAPSRPHRSRNCSTSSRPASSMSSRSGAPCWPTRTGSIGCVTAISTSSPVSMRPPPSPVWLIAAGNTAARPDVGTRGYPRPHGAELNDTISGNDIVLVDFWASWCGPCRAFAPTFTASSDQHPDIVYGKVDTEAEQELAAAAEIRSIPTLMAFQEGQAHLQPGGRPAAGRAGGSDPAGQGVRRRRGDRPAGRERIGRRLRAIACNRAP